ncbi:hypothetical protein GJW-30_1_01241 [Variibacter gotjawalensis]|uniref:L,D-TPase catalytic domain-containing protein n=1 Tax=Variibacter gotjawalensis TaxID=1333996 RepID=A0A0S3PRZ9_9BRAD|nr:murein L,D-transpeptidase family protein [Variibacter gotjawalensis]NIK49024.1 murein L,D-transpeptidase YafK [Variibacter gotjawalensis]RZS50880.1 hypothetical protein EV661_3351 [Variibacter gotjawalensis]BAT58714.1 hypothetical protein GJW-30_1_01241 [Variibacter gotjawalensis]
MASRSFKDLMWLIGAVSVCLVAFMAPVYVILFVLPSADEVRKPVAATDPETTGALNLLEPPSKKSDKLATVAPLPAPKPSPLMAVNPSAIVPNATLPSTFPPIVAATPQPHRVAAAPATLPAPQPMIHADLPGLTPQPHSKLPASQLMAQKGLEKKAPIMLRIFKQEAELEVWKREKSGSYVHLKTYPICRWSGLLGPKVKTGDLQSPEGFYAVTPGAMNPNSAYHLSFNVGFPNAYDRAHGRTGSFLMVHGDCKSVGCYAMTNAQIEEIFQLANDAFDGGQAAFQIQAYPFRMTPANFAKHRNSPHIDFWENLKEGHDLFEMTRQPPQIQVCNGRYGFGQSCGADRIASSLISRLAAKKQADAAQVAALSKKTQAAPLAPTMATRLDGGTHPSFLGMFAQR